MGKTRDLFKKRNISCKDGFEEDRNGTNLAEAEDIKKRWQEYTEKNCTKKIFMTQIIMMVLSVT